MSRNPFIQLLIIGDIRNDFIITQSGKAYNNLVGGPALYAAAGARMGNENVGIVSRIDSKFPESALDKIEKHGIDTNGVLRLKQVYDTRSFNYWQDNRNCIKDNPTAAYSKFGLTFPPDLIGYNHPTSTINEKMWTNISIKMDAPFPHEYMDISGVHLCPIDLATHIKMQALIQKGTATTITLSPSDDYMNPDNILKIPSVIKDITAFIPTEAQITSLFRGQTRDLWEMAEEISKLGCPIVVIQRGEKGFLVYDSPQRAKFVLPNYPTPWIDPTGINDVFAGAFLSEYKRSFDTTRAAIFANASSSIAVEGTGAFYCLDSFPGLLEARQEVLQNLLMKI